MSLPRPHANSSSWSTELLGGPCTFLWRGSAVESSRVWAVSSSSGRQAFLKEPSSRRKLQQEQRALADWSPRLPDLMPGLVGALEQPPALLIEALPGLPGELAMDSCAIALAAHRRAGLALRRLHALSLEDVDPLSLSEALPRRLESWLERSGELLDESRRLRLRERFGDGSAFRGERRVPCHRDLEPRNWLVELEGTTVRALRLVDFEHARLDHALSDFVKLECGDWVDRPQLREALLDGHGGPLDGADEDRLARLVLLHLLATLVQLSEHGDEDGAARARCGLEQRLG